MSARVGGFLLGVPVGIILGAFAMAVFDYWWFSKQESM